MYNPSPTDARRTILTRDESVFFPSYIAWDVFPPNLILYAH